MTTDIEQQEQEKLAQLAGEKCPFDVWGVPCVRCQGTGRKYPGLSRATDIYYHVTHLHDSLYVDCPFCQSDGRVPVSVAEAVLWILEQPWFGQVQTTEVGEADRGAYYACIYAPETTLLIVEVYDDSPALALFAALKASSVEVIE